MHCSLRGSGRSRGDRFSSKLHILWEWCQHLSHRSLSNKTRVRCHGTLRVRWSRQQMPGGPKPTVWTKICSLNDYITLEKVRGFELPKKKSFKISKCRALSSRLTLFSSLRVMQHHSAWYFVRPLFNLFISSGT